MKISYNWLREIGNLTLEPYELARRLTMIGRFLAGGPHKCASNRHADRVVFAFLRPIEMIARRVPAGLS